MPNYKEGLNRRQQLLFPPSMDEYVDENNPVKAIDSYVDSIDLAALRVFTCNGGSEGQPAYHPALLLKIYLYGYLNSIRSSRKLERELKRNIEMMWLCAGLTPGYKTIANFRKDMESVDEKIKEYLSSLEYSDTCENKEITPVVKKENLNRLKKHKARLSSNLHTLQKRNVTQYCKSDPDATLMRKPAHHLMAYNTQIAVNDKYKFIVATDISTKGVDLDQLYPLATQAKKATGNKHIKVAADAGYYNPKEIKKCVDEGIDVYVPIQDKQKQQ